MTLEEIISSLEALDPAERGKILALLLRRRLLEDPSYRADVDRRSVDGDSSHWLKPEQFEERLEDFLRRRLAQARGRLLESIRFGNLAGSSRCTLMLAGYPRTSEAASDIK